MTSPSPRRGRRTLQHGLSLVELLIGVTISLFILAGATVIVSSQLSDNRRMMTEVQLQQDMRAVLDMIGRDLRRAAYWAQAERNVWPSGSTAALANPYTGVTETANSLEYNRSMDEASAGALGTDNNAVDGDEVSGFRYNASLERVEMLVSSGNWQSLTDENVLKVTSFGVTFTTRQVPAPCGAACPVGPLGCPLVLKVRAADISISARAARDATITRSARSNIRLRNDVLAEACPS